MGPYVVRFDWVVTSGVQHPAKSYTDEVESADAAFSKCLRTLQLAATGDVRIQSAWYRQVEPGETLEEGVHRWRYVSLLNPIRRL